MSHKTNQSSDITDVAVNPLGGTIHYTHNDLTNIIQISGFEKWMREVWCGNPRGFVDMGTETQAVFISMYSTYLEKQYGGEDEMAKVEADRDSLAEYTQHPLRPSALRPCLASAHNGRTSDRALEEDSLAQMQAEEEDNNFMAGHWPFKY